MVYLHVDNTNRQRVNKFIEEQWYTTEMIIRGAVVDMTKVDGIICFEDNEIVGLITYVIKDSVCEITWFNSLVENQGIGTELIRRVTEAAKANGCRTMIVVTTNDNIHAIRFYQRHGFDMARFYHNALDVSRTLKPEIPLIGENEIPLKHEIEFEFQIV